MAVEPTVSKGKAFQKQCAEILSHHFSTKFQFPERSLDIGNPPTPHKFDLVSTDSHYVGECKSYSWTKSGGIPHAKIAHVNEEVLRLSHLPKETVRFIVLPKANRPDKDETLADYYHRKYGHLLNGISIIEIDVENNTAREIRTSTN